MRASLFGSVWMMIEIESESVRSGVIVIGRLKARKGASAGESRSEWSTWTAILTVILSARCDGSAHHSIFDRRHHRRDLDS